MGLVGGWVLWEARTGGDRLALAIASLLVAMIATGALVALRELGRDRQQQEATGQLEAAIGNVREIAQTMPPRTFLSDFDRLYQRDYIGTEQQIRAVEEWLGSGQRTEEQREQVLEAIDEMIRTVLDALLDLAWVWDEASTQPGVVYRVNIMRYLSRPELTVRNDWAARATDEMRLLPAEERAAILTNSSGVLLLERPLTTNSLERNTPNPDDPEQLKPLALPVAKVLGFGVTDDRARAEIIGRNLPGAPAAVGLRAMSYVQDSADIIHHCRENRLYSEAARSLIDEYYRGDLKGRSIVSFPIIGPMTPISGDPPAVLGAVNVYRNRPGIMGSRERATQFAFMTGPFRGLLFRLLTMRDEVDQAGGRRQD